MLPKSVGEGTALPPRRAPRRLGSPREQQL